MADEEYMQVDFAGRLDLDLLAKQRESLRFVIDESHYSGDVIQEHLEGIDELLAYIYDALVLPK